MRHWRKPQKGRVVQSKDSRIAGNGEKDVSERFSSAALCQFAKEIFVKINKRKIIRAVETVKFNHCPRVGKILSFKAVKRKCKSRKKSRENMAVKQRHAACSQKFRAAEPVRFCAGFPPLFNTWFTLQGAYVQSLARPAALYMLHILRTR